MAARTARDGDAGLISQTAIELKRDLDRMGYDLHVEPYLSGGRAGACNQDRAARLQQDNQGRDDN